MKELLLPQHLQQADLLVNVVLHQAQVFAGTDCVTVVLQVRNQGHLGFEEV